ncbi:MAG: hypothetical protein ACNA8R_01940 [Nitriliruptoraceae bacterium]
MAADTLLPEGWELVVGLEVHVELHTTTKMWCGCSTTFGDEPNTNVCPVCTGQPGSLPVPNARAIEDATLLGLAIGGAVAERVWARLQRTDDPPMTSFLAEQLATAHWFDQRETRSALGWQPRVSLEEGFARLAASYR